MDALRESLGIKKKFMIQQPEPKEYNSVWNNIPHIDNYNYMADILVLPETKKGFRYLFVVCDLASDDFDIEPLKNKKPEDTQDALIRMYKRKYVGIPKGSMRTDAGSEFKGKFDAYLKSEGVVHRTSLANRHKQTCLVENLNRTLSKLFMGYMNVKEEETGKAYNEWTDVVPKIRKELNSIRHIELKAYFDPEEYPTFSFEDAGKPKFKEGQIVHEKLDWPENALGHKQPTSAFRSGDYTYSRIPKVISQVLVMNDKPYYRYLLQGIPNASFTEHELIKSSHRAPKFKIRKILKKKKIRGEWYRLVWWSGSKKIEATWEKQKELEKDGLVFED
jgi:hypothetical protein